MSEEYVSIKEYFAGTYKKWKALPKWKKIAITVGAALIIASFIGLTLYKAGVIAPATKQITIRAHPYIGEFAADANVTVKIFNKDKIQVATVVLTPPTWSAVIRDLNLRDYYYVTATATGYYWMHWVTSNATDMLPDGTLIIAKNISATAETLDLYFVKVGEASWTETPALSNLADGVETSLTLTYKFNVTPLSALDNVTILVYTNSSSLNVTGIIFGGKEYAVNSTIADFLINNDTEATEYEVGLKITENITGPVLVKVILQYLDEKGEKVQVVAEVVFS